MAPGAGQAAMRLLLLFSSWKAVQALIGSCPTLTTSPYLGEASPFGWPLSPNAWSFVKQQEWGERYLMCEGHRQSPMDIATHGSCVKSGGEDGLLQSAFAYSAIGRETVQVSSYMRSAAVKGDFGSLHLQDAEGRLQQYTAHEAHLSADSWHSMDGQSRVAELMIFHKPKDHPDMLKGGVVVSIFFEQNESAESELFSYMGFPKGPEELEAAEGQWTAQKELLDLPALLQEVTSGPSYMYEGSVPVPPCSETVKYLVLGKALHVHPRQIEKLKDALGCFAGGYKKRLPVANHLWDCRDVFKNSLKVPGPHHGKSCEEFRRAGTWFRVSDCWDGADEDATCVKSPIDLVASKAGDWREKDWESDVGFALGSAQSVTVDASKYTLDAMPSSKAVRASIPNFGSIKVQGRSFLMHKISVKAVSSHSYEGKRHVGEIQVECIMEGDGLRKLSSAVQGTHTEHRLSQEPEPDTQDYHRVILSFPLELGDENVFLDQLGLPVPKYRNAIAHGNEYTVDHVDVKTLLQKGGSWFWYRGGLAVPGCPEWGVRWLLYEKPMTASLAQLNFLDLEVSGMDSTRLEGPQMDAATYKAMVGLQSMPRMAVDKHTACSGKEWNYADPSCWAEQFPLCRNGQRQSPIDVKRSTVLGSGKDNFLAACSWRPVENMHVVNFGKGLAVPGNQLGYITMTGEDGFPQFFEVAQIQLKMPSEHFIDSQGFGAELQIVHRNQQTVTQGINSADSFPFVTTSFFFEIGDKESTLLRQLFLPGILEADTYRVIPQPLDLMRHLGPALDGDFYTYEGSSTSPDCHELNKWFIFEHAFSMSLDQFESFKAMFPSPGNNRPLQPLRSHRLAKNSFEDGTPNHYDFYLGRHEARDRLRPGEFFIVVPIAATLVLMCAIMSSILVRDWAATKKSISGMAEMIGKSSGNRA